MMCLSYSIVVFGKILNEQEILMSSVSQQLPDKLYKELALIPADKLSELYDIIHYFRMGIEYEAQQFNQQKPPRQSGQLKGIFEVDDAAFFEPLPEEELKAWE